jgi:hypothetical protein
MQFDQLKRREFIALLGGGAVVWPLAAELVRLNPNVVVSSPVPANLAIAKLTSTIPIVMASGADPVGFGLVKSLSHPGGNVTGLTNFAEELASKQIDLMRELLPGLARLAALVNVANPLHVPQWRETQAAAAQAAIALVPFELRSPRADRSARRDLHHPPAAHRKSRARRAAPYDFFRPPIRRGRRPDELRPQPSRKLSSRGNLCGQDLEGRKASRPSDRAADQLRLDHQLDDREGTRPRRTGDASRPRRRGDRIGGSMSPYNANVPNAIGISVW